MNEEKNLSIQEAAAQQRRLFGERLRTLRKNANLTQQQLAEKAGLKAPVIVRYEAGRALPRPQAIEKLAAALGVPVSDLDGSSSKADKMKLVNFFNSFLDPKDFKTQAKLSSNYEKVIITDPDPLESFEIELPYEVFSKVMKKSEADTDNYLTHWRTLAFRMFLKENIYAEIIKTMEKHDPEITAKLKEFIANK